MLLFSPFLWACLCAWRMWFCSVSCRILTPKGCWECKTQHWVRCVFRCTGLGCTKGVYGAGFPSVYGTLTLLILMLSDSALSTVMVFNEYNLFFYRKNQGIPPGRGFMLLATVRELVSGRAGSGTPAFWILTPFHFSPHSLHKSDCATVVRAERTVGQHHPPNSSPVPVHSASIGQLLAPFLCCAHVSWWPPCPIPSSAVFSFTLHEFYSQSINKPIIIRVLYSHHISSSVINHFMQESGSFSISHSSLFLSQWLRETN